MMRQSSSNGSRGARGVGLPASPQPRLHRKVDLTRPSGKNVASTLALSKPDMAPQSSPSAPGPAPAAPFRLTASMPRL